MKRRRLLLAIAFAAPVTAVAVACSFPDVEFNDSPDGSTSADGNTQADGNNTGTDGHVNTSDATTDAPVHVPDASPEEDAGADADADAGDIDDSGLDATIRPDSSLPDGGDAGCICDCDNDHYATQAQINASTGCVVAGKGFDCDDNDNRAHPNAGFVQDPPTTTTNGDWDCSGGVDKEYDAGVSCAAHSSIAGLSFDCTTVAGFADAGVLSCGASGSYITCKNNGIGPCVVANTMTVPQGCK